MHNDRIRKGCPQWIRNTGAIRAHLLEIFATSPDLYRGKHGASRGIAFPEIIYAGTYSSQKTTHIIPNYHLFADCLRILCNNCPTPPGVIFFLAAEKCILHTAACAELFRNKSSIFSHFQSIYFLLLVWNIVPEPSLAASLTTWLPASVIGIGAHIFRCYCYCHNQSIPFILISHH
jgi:hypothetical protein